MKPITEALEWLSPEVRAELAKPAQNRDVRYAEIVENRSPKWHVVEVFASAQNDVAAELAKHRFGIYVPEVDETIIRRGRKIDRRVPMFSGYIFVFMWYSDQHWQWITNTPGVIAVVGSLSDEEIDIVRAVENQKRPIIIAIPSSPLDGRSTLSRPRKKRRWKSNRVTKPASEAELRKEIITTRTWSAFDDLIECDSEARNQTLRNALGPWGVSNL